jgi:hypothetical protein
MKQVPVKTEDTAHRVLAGEAVVVNFHSSFFYNLNPVATFIWERCDGSQDLGQIAKAVVAEFKVSPEEAARDCREFVESLVAQGLLAWRAGPEVKDDTAGQDR